MSNQPATPRIEDHGASRPGEVVFYAHGCESLRTFLGLSKFHARADCSALARRGGTIVRDVMSDVEDRQRCKLCHPSLARRPQE